MNTKRCRKSLETVTSAATATRNTIDMTVATNISIPAAATTLATNSATSEATQQIDVAQNFVKSTAATGNFCKSC